MIKVGMMIADRYEIIEKIGTGGMSDVYRAKCHKLNRFVAVKVLKQEFSENTDFVSKFRVEAQAAAGLMHPNIVNVYDVGDENGFYYIVMELVEGITLKKYIEKKARLSVKEAVSIAIQVSMGIEAAHNNNIIHRDIKPQNIIISKEGKVKVTDFGIAKAATSNTITSNVMGSVHYTSPEQVRGGFSDEKSDIYSLGITLFEMLTGRVPFNGETTVAVAIKHIQEAMPSPRDFVPEIPISVEQIVLKCTQKSPDRRYQSAPELIEDLKKSLISPDENFVKIESNDSYGATKNISDVELESIRSKTRQRDNYEERIAKAGKNKNGNTESMNKTGNNKRAVEKAKKLAEENPSDYRENEYDEEVRVQKKNPNTSPKKPKNSHPGKNSKPTPSKKAAAKNKKDEFDPKMELVTTILIVIAAIIIGCVFLYIIARALGINLMEPENVNTATVSQSEPGPDESDMNEEQPIAKAEDIGAKVPSVVGMSKAEATATLEGDGYIVVTNKMNSDSVQKDQVISQSPEGGELLERGSEVTINISLGAEVSPVTMPSLIGKPEDEAVAILVENGLEPKAGTPEYSDTYEEGMVIYQGFSAGLTVNSGTEVEYRTSLGVEQVFYNCIYSVQAPADYTGGDAEVVLKASDGTQLFATTTNTFPVNINVSNIFGISSGQLYISYNVNQAQEVTDAEGNVTVQNVQVQASSGPTTVNFTKAE